MSTIYVHRENLTLPDRRPLENYPTPSWLCDKACALIDGTPLRILDPGAGLGGAWGWAARKRWPNAWIEGVEIQPSENPGPYSIWWGGHDYRVLGTEIPGFDVILGNPPYNLLEEFIANSLRRLNFGGVILFMTRLAFLEGQKRRDTLWRDTPPRRVWVVSKRPSFNADGKGTNATAFALISWTKDWRGETTLGWI